MKHVKLYEQFLNEASVNPDVNPEDVALVKELEKALLSNFKDVSFQRGGKDEKYYDWGGGYINISNKYQTPDWSWLDAKRTKILQNCNISPLYVRAEITYFEVISKAPPKEARGFIGVAGMDYISHVTSFDLANPKKANISKSVKDFVKNSQKEPLTKDLISRLLANWTPSKSSYKTIDTRDQGIGRHASTHITKAYDRAYVIKDLNVAFSTTEELAEQMIREHYSFRKDRLDFDWKQGVMIVGGQYVEVWD
jgi:hypothetical protein